MAAAFAAWTFWIAEFQFNSRIGFLVPFIIFNTIIPLLAFYKVELRGELGLDFVKELWKQSGLENEYALRNTLIAWGWMIVLGMVPMILPL